MNLDDGTLRICTLQNVGEAGQMPRQVLTPIRRHWYGERSIGYNRQYAAKGVNEHIDLLVRIVHDRAVRIGMYAVLGNGEQYRIDHVMHGGEYDYFSQITGPMGTGSLRYTELTLSRLEALYDVAEPEPDTAAGAD